MKITIIIPVYNVAPYIEDCIRSVIRQTWQGSMECILIDDCGTDDSMAVVDHVLQDYEGEIDFRIVRHERNRGLSAARNSGIDAATGDYVYFLDSDDEITSDCMELLANALQEEPYDFVIGNYRMTGTSRPGPLLKLLDGSVLRERQILHAYRRQDWYMMSVNKLYRLAFLNQHCLRFYEGILHEDELWSFQIACMARLMCVVGSDTYIYKVREGSITEVRFSPRQAESLNIILKEMVGFAGYHGLRENVDVHHTIENFRMGCLSRVGRDMPEQFADYYRQQRLMMGTSWSRCFRIDGKDMRKQLRDFHLALPVLLAVPYLRLLLSYYNRLS